MWLNEKTRKMLFQIRWDICFNDVTKQVFLNGEGLQILILGIFTTQMLHKQYKSLHVALLERLFILLAIYLINESRDPFPFINYVDTHSRLIIQNLVNSL